MEPLSLSKPFVDVGYFTTQGDRLVAFYADTAGLKRGDTLAIEPGYDLFRFDACGSALKVNSVSGALCGRRTNLGRVTIAAPGISEARELRDPDGNELLLVPPGEQGIDQVGIDWTLPSDDAVHRFAQGGLGAERLARLTYRLGKTVLQFRIDPRAERTGPLEALGFTYTTLHVMDVVSTHGRLIAHGCIEAIPPTAFRGVTAYSFVRDPAGNWIEISQRADLTGKPVDDSLVGFSVEKVREVRRAP